MAVATGSVYMFVTDDKAGKVVSTALLQLAYKFALLQIWKAATPDLQTSELKAPSSRKRFVSLCEFSCHVSRTPSLKHYKPLAVLQIKLFLALRRHCHEKRHSRREQRLASSNALRPGKLYELPPLEEGETFLGLVGGVKLRFQMLDRSVDTAIPHPGLQQEKKCGAGAARL
eukprot:5025320-Amphidinium_carterae.1